MKFLVALKKTIVQDNLARPRTYVAIAALVAVAYFMPITIGPMLFLTGASFLSNLFFNLGSNKDELSTAEEAKKPLQIRIGELEAQRSQHQSEMESSVEEAKKPLQIRIGELEAQVNGATLRELEATQSLRYQVLDLKRKNQLLIIENTVQKNAFPVLQRLKFEPQNNPKIVTKVEEDLAKTLQAYRDGRKKHPIFGASVDAVLEVAQQTRLTTD